MSGFQSVFREPIAAYVELRRGLGYQFKDDVPLLRAFDRYVHEKGSTELSQQLALAFATDNPNSSNSYRFARYKVVRQFSDYLAIFDPQTPWLDPKALPFCKTRRQPYIYTDEEIARLLHQARHISMEKPVRGVTLHAMVGLAASTGLRISEVVGLDRKDVNLETGILLVRQSKFGKDRYVPVHSTTLQILRNYAIIRDTVFVHYHDPAFFLSLRRRRFCSNTLQQAFCKIARRAGLRPPKGRGPTFHDLRHRFAVKRLVAWYKAGVDVQAMLPALATYMGHVCYSDTAYYLTASAELLELAAERSQSSCPSREAQR
jgi:integrase